MSGLTQEQWPLFVKDVFRVCKPGTGWAQLIEASAYLSCDDGTVPKDSPIWEVRPMHATDQYQRYEHEIFEVEKRFIWNPYHIETRLQEAGFVDVQIKKVHVKIGSWVTGCTHCIRLTIDTKLRAAAYAATDVWSGVVDPLVDKMISYYPDAEKRTQFSKRTVRDMKNRSYHLYSPMYDFPQWLLTRRICAVGRRPEMDITQALVYHGSFILNLQCNVLYQHMIIFSQERKIIQLSIQAKELAQQVQATTSADFECITTDYHEFSSILFQVRDGRFVKLH